MLTQMIQLIQPQTISSQTIREEIAYRLNIAAQQIKKIEYWQHQLWIHITGKGGKILSYRILPAWFSQVLNLIRNCTTLAELQELGKIFRVETQRFFYYYSEEKIQEMRELWAAKHQEIKAKEKEEEPLRQHRQDAMEWLESWQKMAARCQVYKCLEYSYKMVEFQKQEFEDLPEIVDQVIQTLNERVVELERRELAETGML